MTFRRLATVAALFFGLMVVLPGAAEAKRSVFVRISPHGVSIYIGPRYHVRGHHRPYFFDRTYYHRKSHAHSREFWPAWRIVRRDPYLWTRR